MSSTSSRDNTYPTDSSDPVVGSKQELLKQLSALSSKYADLEREYESLLVEYRNTLETLDRSRKASARLESQLYAASRQVENAKKIQSEFLDTISHELLTPLNGILGMARILEELPLKPEIQESIDTISSCGEELERILKNLLDYIHLSKGEIDFIPKRFNLQECIESVLKEYTSTIYLKHLEVTHLPDHGVYNAIEMDRDRFEQILHILLSNAVKFTNEGHILIRSHIKHKASSYLSGEPGYEIILSIQDTGIGISAHDLQNIFRPFEQLDSSRNRSYGGIGIGLTLCKEIISQMGGSIMIDSELDRGSIFAVSLPVQSVSRSRRSRNGKLPKLNVDVLVATIHKPNKILLEKILAGLKVNNTFIDVSSSQNITYQEKDILIVDYPSNPLDAPVLNELITKMHQKQYSIIGLLPQHNHLLPQINSSIDVVVKKPFSSHALADALAFAANLRQPVGDTEGLAQEPLSASNKPLVRVLMAENNPVNQKIVQHLLGMLGCFVDTVNNLDELKEKYQPGVYSSVVINPGITPADGLVQLKEFAFSIASDSETTLVAITGLKSPYTYQQLIDAGMDDHITLPTKLETLAEALHIPQN